MEPINLAQKLGKFSGHWPPRVIAETNDYQFKRVKLELFVVPRGAEHITRSARECHAMLIEPRGVVNTGEAGGASTAPAHQWI
jgi:hypothetical protein